MIEGIVERKSWLHEILDDLMVLIWAGTDRASVMAQVKADLDLLYHSLNQGEHPLDEHGRVMNREHQPIAGLYAAGNSTASVMGRSYPGAGGTIGPAMVFAYIGMLHAAGSAA